MKIKFNKRKLEQMAYDLDYVGKWSSEVIRMYRNRIITIKQAKNRLDLYALKSLRLEKLKGPKRHLHSMRINDQYRLVISIGSPKGSNEEIITILDVEDYHR